VGVTFSLWHRKYVFSGEVVGSETYNLGPATTCTALKLTAPAAMHRVERRLHARHDVSHDEVTRASFWLGGRDARPQESEVNVEAPVWSGRVMNLSGGGLHVRASFEAAKYLEVGDIVGIHLMFGSEDQAAFLDAQLRHCQRDNEMALMGFQFLEPDEPRKGDARALRLIREKIRARQKPQPVAV